MKSLKSKTTTPYVSLTLAWKIITVLLQFKFPKKLHLLVRQVKNRIHYPDSKIHKPWAIRHYLFACCFVPDLCHLSTPYFSFLCVMFDNVCCRHGSVTWTRHSIYILSRQWNILTGDEQNRGSYTSFSKVNWCSNKVSLYQWKHCSLLWWENCKISKHFSLDNHVFTMLDFAELQLTSIIYN